MHLSSKLSRKIIEADMVSKPADLVNCKGTRGYVQSGEFVTDTDIAIKDGTIGTGGRDESISISTLTK